jgi:hypothetical protein
MLPNWTDLAPVRNFDVQSRINMYVSSLLPSPEGSKYQTVRRERVPNEFFLQHFQKAGPDNWVRLAGIMFITGFSIKYPTHEVSKASFNPNTA